MKYMNIATLFNIPNCIGYVRVILLIISIHCINLKFCIFYSISAMLDAVDGKAARKFNMSTFLGSCLDMITDRVSTIIIIYKISSNQKAEFLSDYKSQIIIMLSYIIMIDIISHFMYFSFSISMKTHHKVPKNYLLSIYYRKNVLLVLCTTVEMFYLVLYLCICGYKLNIFAFVLFPFCLVKTCFHIVQLYVALCGLSLYEHKLKE